MRVNAKDPEGRNARAYLDGVDVSAECVRADNTEGWVDLLVKDESGKTRVTLDEEPEIKRVYGVVEIVIDDADSSLYA